MCTNGTQVPCEVPSLPNPRTHKVWSHHQGLRTLLFSSSHCDKGSFTSHKNKSVKVLSLSEKTRKANHLQVSLERQPGGFLLRYFKTLSVSLAGVRTRDLPLSRPRSPNLTNQAVKGTHEIIAQHKFPGFASFNTLWLLYRSSQANTALILEDSQCLCCRIKLQTRKIRIYGGTSTQSSKFCDCSQGVVNR